MDTTLHIEQKDTGNELLVSLKGTLNCQTANDCWQQLILSLPKAKAITIDVGAIEVCDGSGLTILSIFQARCAKNNVKCAVTGLPLQFKQLWGKLNNNTQNEPSIPLEMRLGHIQRLGKSMSDGYITMKENVSYFGEMIHYMLLLLRHPKMLDPKKLFYYMNKIGPDSLPLIILIGLLFGIILSFQSVIALKLFGAELYTPNLVAMSMFRELGPLLMAIIITGRSASAFAAEISTMKTNEELDALVTMGLDPVPYLIIPRLIAAAIVAPFLSLILNIFSMLGCLMVMLTQGFNSDLILQQMFHSLGTEDLLTGLFKSVIFGFVVVAIGCIHGLNSGRNAMAVGVATTNTVVRCIVMITILDGIFTIIFYSIGL